MERDLDIRNLIKAQDLLRTFVKLKVQKREKRKLMRMQRANVILEADSDSNCLSLDSDDDLKDFRESYKMFKGDFDNLVEDDEKHNGQDH